MTIDAVVLLGLAGAVIVGLWVRMFARRPREGTTRPEHAANGTGDRGPGGGHQAADSASTDGDGAGSAGAAGSGGAGAGGDGAD